MISTSTLFRTCALATALSVAACGNDGSTNVAQSSGAQNTCMSRGDYGWGGPFSLIDQTGTPVTQEDYMGRPTLMYFGYTVCPDACPVIMEKITYALDELPEGMVHPRVMLISFDPERDTPEVLSAYVSNPYYPEDMVGLTGSYEQIREAADAFQAIYSVSEQEDSAIGYVFDHSAAIYLMDENWEMDTFFIATENPRAMADCMTNFLPQAEG